VQLSAVAGVAAMAVAVTAPAIAQLTLKYHPIAHLLFSVATPAIEVAGKVSIFFSLLVCWSNKLG
jgi:hypothetical protein